MRALAGAVLVLLIWISMPLAGCAGGSGEEVSKSPNTHADSEALQYDEPLADDEAQVRSNGSRVPSPVVANAALVKPVPSSRAKSGSGGGGANANATRNDGSWGIVLLTYAQDGHRKTAESARADIVFRFPTLSDAYLVSKNTGSAIFVGHYTSPNDPAARTRMDAVKAIQDGANKPFIRAMLTRCETSSTPPGKFDLRQVRLRNPDEHPLYSLQVAVWSDLQSGEMSLAEIRGKAEACAEQLRLGGLMAFYHHDDHRKMSTVTVGVFNSKAYNPRSTLFAPEVEALMRQFPKHLVNGEPLLVQVDPADSTNMQPQRCRLVEIPR
ncbi:MAG: hypothetical protein EXS00_03625 [Phycisphaerales bacterium]|nr:hypothetical protein [Phycisphaerales bacterium]